jgi:hypothetical protein
MFFNFLCFAFGITETPINLFWNSPLKIFLGLLEICRLKTDVIIGFMILVTGRLKVMLDRSTDSKKPIHFVILKYFSCSKNQRCVFATVTAYVKLLRFRNVTAICTDNVRYC